MSVELQTIPAPLVSTGASVLPEWIDHNGHMNVAFYVMAFDESVGDILDFVGLTRAFKKRHNCGTFVGDFHIHYARELLQGAPIRITNQIIGYDRKRFHYCQQMFHAEENFLAAQSEAITLHIDMATRRVAPMHDEIYDKVAALAAAHAQLPAPSNAGRTIRVKRG